jgi:hypothetical protein
MAVDKNTIALLDAMEHPSTTPTQRKEIAQNLKTYIGQHEDAARLLRELCRAYGLLNGDVWMHEANPLKNNVTQLKVIQS